MLKNFSASRAHEPDGPKQLVLSFPVLAVRLPRLERKEGVFEVVERRAAAVGIGSLEHEVETPVPRLDLLRPAMGERDLLRALGGIDRGLQRVIINLETAKGTWLADAGGYWVGRRLWARRGPDHAIEV